MIAKLKSFLKECGTVCQNVSKLWQKDGRNFLTVFFPVMRCFCRRRPRLRRGAAEGPGSPAPAVTSAPPRPHGSGGKGPPPGRPPSFPSRSLSPRRARHPDAGVSHRQPPAPGAVSPAEARGLPRARTSAAALGRGSPAAVARQLRGGTPAMRSDGLGNKDARAVTVGCGGGPLPPARRRGARRAAPPPPGPASARGGRGEEDAGGDHARARAAGRRAPGLAVGPGRGACSWGPAGLRAERGWRAAGPALPQAASRRVRRAPGAGRRRRFRSSGEGRDGSGKGKGVPRQ